MLCTGYWCAAGVFMSLVYWLEDQWLSACARFASSRAEPIRKSHCMHTLYNRPQKWAVMFCSAGASAPAVGTVQWLALNYSCKLSSWWECWLTAQTITGWREFAPVMDLCLFVLLISTMSKFSEGNSMKADLLSAKPGGLAFSLQTAWCAIK